MRDRILFYFKYFLFWFLLFWAYRLCFIVYTGNELSKAEFLLSFLYGSKLDISLASYFLTVPTLLLLIEHWVPKLPVKKIVYYYTIVLLLVVGLVQLIDAKLYTYWGYKFGVTALRYLDKPEHIFSSLTVTDVLAPVAIWMVFCFMPLWMYKLIFMKNEFNIRTTFSSFLVFLFFASTIFIPMRGGFDLHPLQLGIPINSSSVYFSGSNLYANHVALNSTWHFFKTTTSKSTAGYVPGYLSNEEAEGYFKDINVSGVKSAQLIDTAKQPNVVLIIWESLTAEVVEVLGGNPGVTPNLNRLSKEGILFSNFYASGERSDKGMVALMSAFPVQPTTTIIKEASKVRTLPFISQELKNEGYHASFYYGGDISFSDFNRYFVLAGMDEVKSKSDYPSELHTSKWGVHDHNMFQSILTDLDNVKEPFFTSLFTLSSHNPFDVPHESSFKSNSEDDKFCNSIHYSDKCLGDFIAQAKKKAWWDNSIVIVVADHGYRVHDIDYVSKENYRIPMLWLGGALEKRDTVINSYGSQVDFAATLLHQLNMSSEKFSYSKDILSEQTNHFAFYSYTNGFGYVTDSSYFVYDNETDLLPYEEGKNEELTKNHGKAYCKKVCLDFKSR